LAARPAHPRTGPPPLSTGSAARPWRSVHWPYASQATAVPSGGGTPAGTRAAVPPEQ